MSRFVCVPVCLTVHHNELALLKPRNRSRRHNRLPHTKWTILDGSTHWRHLANTIKRCGLTVNSTVVASCSCFSYEAYSVHDNWMFGWRCVGGWQGERCDDCVMADCCVREHATCAHSPGRCDCLPGWTGHCCHIGTIQLSLALSLSPC